MRSIVGRELHRVTPTRVKIPDESRYHTTHALMSEDCMSTFSFFSINETISFSRDSCSSSGAFSPSVDSLDAFSPSVDSVGASILRVHD